MREGEHNDTPPWWAALAGGLVFAACIYGLLWAFAILGWVMEALG